MFLSTHVEELKMKQGTGNSQVGDTKREPTSRSVDPCAVADIGIQQVYTVSKPLYDGRGFEAPMAGTDSHPAGSQGKH
jgi:hypothetical protein